ncbi:MAG TPA: hypothetical protein VFP84_33495 [Kofleriaceae bacterium]|nr:hypothetical protein [Kofleriaceae bacterium]
MTIEMSFSALCQYIGASTATARRNILRQQKYPADGPMLSYVAAEQRIISHLVDHAPLDSNVEPAHCREALEMFAGFGWPIRDIVFSRPSTYQPKMLIGLVEISLKPSLLLTDIRGRRGACKLFFRKAPAEDKPQLEEAVARKMASLLYYYGHDFQLESEYAPELCSVWCVRDGEIINSTGRLSRLLDDVKANCAEIELLWPAV